MKSICSQGILLLPVKFKNLKCLNLNIVEISINFLLLYKAKVSIFTKFFKGVIFSILVFAKEIFFKRLNL